MTIRNRTNFETNRLGGGYTSYTITGNTKLEDKLTPKGGGNVTVLALAFLVSRGCAY